MKNLFVIFLVFLSRLVSSQDKPNIIIILADDLGYGDLGCFGSPDIKTPNLDYMARQGVRLTNFYSNGTVCSPTRTALLTGRYQQRVGGMEAQIGSGNIGRYDEALELSDRKQLGLPPDFNAIPSLLNQKGYNTAIVGKWHLGYYEPYRPMAHGFDYSIGNLGGGVDYFHHTERLGAVIDGVQLPGSHDLFRDDIPFHRREGYYMTHLITDESVEWINIQNRDKPFFLYVAYTAPHTPIQGPNDFLSQQKTPGNWGSGDKETYFEMIEAMDRGVGKILQKLDEKGFSDNTLIVFFSDNGCTRMGNAGPLTGNKGQVFEGGIRVPCIVKWPGRINPGLISDQMAITMDFTASVAAIIDAEPQRPFDGIDIVGHLVSGKEDFFRTLFWRYKYYENVRKAVRDGNMKYIYDLNNNQISEYLFDLESDIGEKNNLAESEKGHFLRLKRILETWETEVRPERFDFFNIYSGCD